MVKATVTRSRFATQHGIATYSFQAQNGMLGVSGKNILAWTDADATRIAKQRLHCATVAARIGNEK